MAPVAQRLESTRGYAGNVTYRENATKIAATRASSNFPAEQLRRHPPHWAWRAGVRRESLRGHRVDG